MKKYLFTATILLAGLATFSACQDDDVITPSGNYSPIRGGFPQGTSEYDTIIYNIKQEYGVYLLYKDVTEEDMNKAWTADGTKNIIIAGDNADRDKGVWELTLEHLPFYVDFFQNYIFPNITKDFAKSTFPVKIYMIHNLREEKRKLTDDEDTSEDVGTGLKTNINLYLGTFDNWVISFPESVINGEDSEYILRQQRCIFMTNIIKKSIESGTIVAPKGFWEKYSFAKSESCDTDKDHTKCTMVEVVDQDAENHIYKIGFVDVMEEKFGTGNTTEVIKNVNIGKGKELHTINWKATSKDNSWDMFQAYIMNAMWFTPEDFDERYQTDVNTIIKEQYDLVVNHMKEEYGIDLVGIARGIKE